MLTRRAKAYTSFSSQTASLSPTFSSQFILGFLDNHVSGGVGGFDAACAGLHEPRVSGLKLLKFTFNAENFIRKVSWSNSSHFVAIQY